MVSCVPGIHPLFRVYGGVAFEWHKESPPREESWFILSRQTADLSAISPSLGMHQLSYIRHPLCTQLVMSRRSISGGCTGSVLSSLQSWLEFGIFLGARWFLEGTMGPFDCNLKSIQIWACLWILPFHPCQNIHPPTSGSGPWCEIWTHEMCEVCAHCSNEDKSLAHAETIGCTIQLSWKHY